MIRSVKDLIGYKIDAADGEVGEIDDFFFDDQHWMIRYLVAHTGKRMKGKNVLIAPAAFYGSPDWQTKKFQILLSRDKVWDSPEVDADMTVSRQKELEILKHYKWPIYWMPSEGGPADLTAESAEIAGLTEGNLSTQSEVRVHLRSMKKVLTYDVADESREFVGHAQDFILNDENWFLEYLILKTGKWLQSSPLRVPLPALSEINWDRSEIILRMSKKNIEACPQYHADTPVNQKDEVRYYDYRGRPLK